MALAWQSSLRWLSAHFGSIPNFSVDCLSAVSFLRSPVEVGGEAPVAREQRKLAAIVAADVVGYSRLMGRDESGTLARLREHRKERLEPILARYGGRIVK